MFKQVLFCGTCNKKYSTNVKMCTKNSNNSPVISSFYTKFFKNSSRKHVDGKILKDSRFVKVVEHIMLYRTGATTYEMVVHVCFKIFPFTHFWYIILKFSI